MLAAVNLVYEEKKRYFSPVYTGKGDMPVNLKPEQPFHYASDYYHRQTLSYPLIIKDGEMSTEVVNRCQGNLSFFTLNCSCSSLHGFRNEPDAFGD